MYQAALDPLPEETKQKLLELSKNTKPAFDGKEIGLVYLDNDSMLEIFAPYMQKHFGKKMKFWRCWTHWMKKGGARPSHKHSQWTYLYYLDIPGGDCGNLIIDDKIVEPIEGTHIMFPGNTAHSITSNNTEKTRWAFAANCVSV